MIALSRYSPRSTLAMHRHADAYCALVLSGRYEERSADGRWLVEQGDIVIHPQYHAHANAFSGHGAIVVDLAVRATRDVEYGVWRLQDPDAVLRGDCSIEDVIAAGLRRASEAPVEWMTLMAAILRQQPVVISEVARQARVSREHAARSFMAWYGLSPAAFAREHRLRRVVRSLNAGEPFALVAQREGFSDQPHMTRTIRRDLGVTPSQVAKGATRNG